MNRFKRGAHSLSYTFNIDDRDTLHNAMEITARNGGKIFEIPYVLCKLPWREVAQIARNTLIEEISLCHFWAKDKDDEPIWGDPLGDTNEAATALTMVDAIISAGRVIRDHGVRMRFIDGPSWGCLGKDYSHLPIGLHEQRATRFLRTAGQMCAEAEMMLVVEFLRREEDKVFQGTQPMLDLLEMVGHLAVLMHFDLYHSIQCDKDPVESIRKAKKRIAYLHLHGDDRLAPGQKGDKRNWPEIVKAINEIDSGVSDIPVIPEPFGEKTCKECPELGQGLPPALPLGEYLPLAYKTLTEAGLEAA